MLNASIFTHNDVTYNYLQNVLNKSDLHKPFHSIFTISRANFISTQLTE